MRYTNPRLLYFTKKPKQLNLTKTN